MSLSHEHLEKIQSSAISADHAAKLAATGWRTDAKGRLVIPYRNPDGSPQTMPDGSAWIRFRLPQSKINANPKGPKYLSAEKSGCRLYHPALSPDHAKRLADHDVPLRIIEGELKAESCALHDPKRVTIGIGGVNSWQDKRSGDTQPLPEFDQIPLMGREVRLCFDSDLHKPRVRSALAGLAIWLAKSEKDGGKGAIVYLERLPNAPERDRRGEIVRLGADDLIHEYGRLGFRRICDIADKCIVRVLDEETGKYNLHFRIPYDPEPEKAEATFIRAEYLTALLGRTWRSDPDRPDGWQRWTGTHWERVEGNDPINAAVERFLDCQGWRAARAKANVSGLVAAFRRQIEPATDASASAGLLPFRNGCLRLSDLAFLPHQPERGNTWSLPYDYDPAATCPKILEFLKDRLEDSDSIAIIRAYIRVLLINERSKTIIEFTGPGDTGKTVLANLLIALVGTGNVAAMTLQRLEDRAQRFETLKLRGARLAVFSECQDYSGQLQMLKAITGGDPIPAEVKGGRHVDFTFTGGVVLVGNGPIRASDPTGAVINRRRAFHIGKVVSTKDQRTLLETDGMNGWRGELVPELPGLVNWALAMPAADARLALARDVQSLARAEAEMRALLNTDLLAEWANEHLIWDPGAPAARVGRADVSPDGFLFPSYLRFIEHQGRNGRPLTLRTFKLKLVDLLRDTLGLALPPGDISSGAYREREKGSVVPFLRWRRASDSDDAPGVIRHAYLSRVRGPSVGTDQEPPGTDAERIGNGKTPLGNGWNGWNGSEQVRAIESAGTDAPDVCVHMGEGWPESVPSVPSIPHKGSHRSASVPEPVPSVPHTGQPVLVDGQPGWRLPGAMPKGNGPTVRVPLVDPQGTTRPIERGRIDVGPTTSAA
jgi:phage/plasmid-associated DNA primase